MTSRVRVVLCMGGALLLCCSNRPPFEEGGDCIEVLQNPPNQGWDHYTSDSVLEWQAEPPTSGPHFTEWTRYGAYSTPIPRGYWIHNLEHGGIVMLYRSDAPASIVAQMRAVYAAMPRDPQCDHSRTVLTPD